MKISLLVVVTVALALWINFSTNAFGATASSSLWSGATVPVLADGGPDTPVELGVKFRSDTSGSITGIRFYKAAANNGTHVGNLWTSTGTRLATATFTNETASGWQQVNFSTPVTITSNTVYVASYHSNNGHYSDDGTYFLTKGVDATPLHAPKDGDVGFNGIYAYGSGSNFPTQGWNSSNYYVDVVFTPATADTTPPTVTVFNVPASSTTLSVPINGFSATDNVAVTGYLITDSSVAPSPASSGWSAAPITSFTFTSAGPKTLYAWAEDAGGNVSAGKSANVTITLNSDRPMLLITSASYPFSSYYAEILRAEGLNCFSQMDIASVTAPLLTAYDVVLVGEMPLTAAQVTMFSSWVNGGGHLITMRPDKKLGGLLGLVDRGAALSNGYLLIDTSNAPGSGLVDQTIQFHGIADLYTLDGATNLATLFADSKTATTSPAVTLVKVGSNGGQAAAFTFDLARSIIYTRQGNPNWAGQHRDGVSPTRSDDLFFGAATFDPQPDWVDFARISIPQADEQQRFLANLIIQMNLQSRPIPRFWYLPRSLPAVVIMTGDDHASGGTAGRFDSYVAKSPSDCSVSNWECVRGTSYVFNDTPLSNDLAAAYSAAGFEIGLHVLTDCADWTPASLDYFYTNQLATWKAKYGSLPSPVTNRTHCIVWSDYSTQPLVELTHGIRMDTNYYYWPASWVMDRPGFFTGSGMPMRFADATGNLIDVYQAATEMTDESGQSYPFTIDTLLDNAIGTNGYYGAFVVNAHTDVAASSVSDAVVNSARSRGIPVISARQLLTWVDGRNASTFNALTFDGTSLSFSINAAQGATGLVAMVPVANGKTVDSVTYKGNSIPFKAVRIKGTQYAIFGANSGAYRVVYTANVTVPTVIDVTPDSGATSVATTTKVMAAFSRSMDPASIKATTFLLRDTSNSLVPSTVTYDSSGGNAILSPNSTLGSAQTYTATIVGGVSGVKDLQGDPLASDFTWSFSTATATTGTFSVWSQTAVPSVPDGGPDDPVEIGVKFNSDTNGYITGILFYKSAANTGTHFAHLWTKSGQLLATATFNSESPSGWQRAEFSTAVPVAANTIYIASYHTDTGHYSDDLYYFAAKGVDAAPLHFPVNSSSDANGVYTYGPAGSFPSQGWNSSNYWVDVIFTTTLP